MRSLQWYKRGAAYLQMDAVETEKFDKVKRG